MYIYDGSKYTEEEIQNAANKAGLSLEDYTSKNNITFEEEVEEVAEVKTKEVSQDTTSADLLDPTTFQEDAAAGAVAGSQPMTASQAGYVEPEDTVLPSVDTSLDSPDPDPDPDSPDDSIVLDEIVIKAKTKSKKEKVNEIFQENIYNDLIIMVT